MTELRDSRFARRQTMLRKEVCDGAIRRAFLTQLDDDFLRREQILELLRTAWREFLDRLADCGWIKGGHRLDCGRCKPGNWLAAECPRRCGGLDSSLPELVRGPCLSVAGRQPRQVRGCRLPAKYPRPLLRRTRGQLKPRRCHGRGLFALSIVGPDWTRLRTVCEHGSAATAACSLPVHARGLAAIVFVRDSYRADVLRIHRDCFADAESFGTKG